MKYESVVAGRFLARPNRFIAYVDLDGHTETVHVKNTGRCRELLVPGAQVYLAEGTNPVRKTRYDLVAVEKGTRLVNMDSQAPNAAALEWLRAGNVFPPGAEIRPEYRYGDSRFDIAAFIPELALLEVKGVTLERDGAVLFPDAPTARGVKHLRELAAFPGEIRLAAAELDPSRINRYATELASRFHKFYNACRIRGEAKDVAEARLGLAAAVKQVLENALGILGVTAPESM